MNTQQLECFVTLAKNLNYAKTTEDLCLSQPAVSRQIQSLEAELNTKLFNRTTRSVSLTQVGFQFWRMPNKCCPSIIIPLNGFPLSTSISARYCA